MHLLWHDESGLTTVEYALLIVLIAIAGLTAWQLMSSTTSNMVNNLVDAWP